MRARRAGTPALEPGTGGGHPPPLAAAGRRGERAAGTPVQCTWVRHRGGRPVRAHACGSSPRPPSARDAWRTNDERGGWRPGWDPRAWADVHAEVAGSESSAEDTINCRTISSSIMLMG